MNLLQELHRIKELNSTFGVIIEASKVKTLIDKLGFSEENAKLLDSLCGPLSVWMANKIIDEIKSIHPNPDAVVIGPKIRPYQQKITSIMDYIRVGLNGNIKDIKGDTFIELYNKSVSWHESLGGGKAKINYKETHPIILDFRTEDGTGFYWVNLETNDSKEECERMGHCGRSSRGNLYSLRQVTPISGSKYTLNRSYLTAAISDDGILYQLKGPSNTKPSSEFHQYITPLFNVKDELNEEYLIQGFGSEYASERDFKLADLPNETLLEIYKQRPELFDTRSLQRKLVELGVIEKPQIDYNFELKIDPDDIQRYIKGGWEVSRRRKNKEGKWVGRDVDIFETILSGDLWDVWQSGNYSFDDILDWISLSSENEKKIWELLNMVATPEELKDLSLEEAIKEYDYNSEISNSITSSYESAELDDFYNHMYELLKNALGEYGEIKSIDDTGVVLQINAEPFINSADDDYVDDYMETFDNNIKDVFVEMVLQGDIEKPDFGFDDRWSPSIDDSNFNEILRERLGEAEYVFEKEAVKKTEGDSK